MPETEPAPAPVDETLAQRVAAAARVILDGTGPRTVDEWANLVAAAVLAELAPELARAQEAAREVDRLTELLGQYADRAIANGQRADQAETRRVELADALGLQAQRDMLGWPALIEAVRTLQTLKDDHRTHAEQVEELLQIAHETSNRSEAERARAVQRAETAELALAAGIPLICSDERHQAKVAALETEVQRMRYYVAACGEDGHAVRMAATATQRAEQATAALREVLAAITTYGATGAHTVPGERVHVPGRITDEQLTRWQRIAHGQEA